MRMLLYVRRADREMYVGLVPREGSVWSARRDGPNEREVRLGRLHVQLSRAHPHPALPAFELDCPWFRLELGRHAA
jgi:hypothetical protein